MIACLLFTYQWIILVPVIGGRDYITLLQGNIYPGIYIYILPVFMLPTGWKKTAYHILRFEPEKLNRGQKGLQKIILSRGYCENWCIQGPFLGFRWSKDDGKTWNEPREVLKGDLVGKMGSVRILWGRVRWIWSFFCWLARKKCDVAKFAVLLFSLVCGHFECSNLMTFRRYWDKPQGHIKIFCKIIVKMSSLFFESHLDPWPMDSFDEHIENMCLSCWLTSTSSCFIFSLITRYGIEAIFRYFEKPLNTLKPKGTTPLQMPFSLQEMRALKPTITLIQKYTPTFEK